MIDGWSDPGYVATPVVVLNGSGAGAVSGLTLGAGSAGSVVRGLVIQTFGDSGIVIQSNGNTVAGNFIGTDVTGLLDRGNTNDGIVIVDAANNIIGGTTAAERNVLSGNSVGIRIGGANASGNVIAGNYVGADANGAATLGNSIYGIFISRFAGAVTGDPHGNRVGGITPSEANLITANTQQGVAVFASAGIVNNAILGNQIYGNGGLGIDLAHDGITANDAGDADTGANNLQNFPVLTSANANAAGTTLAGTLNSNAGTSYRIEFFANRPSVADATNGEGERYLGFVSVTTNGSGNASFNSTLANVWINAGAKVTATATVDLGGGKYGSTSEFGANINATSTGIVVVDTISDVSDGTTTSITALGNARGADGRISLREAVTAANNTANGGTPDKIVFNIAGSGVRTIAPTSALPTISNAVVIDATAQAGYAGTPLVELNGAGAGASGFQITAAGGGSTIKGFTINRFTVDGIYLNTSNNNLITQNYLGTNSGGTADLGNTRFGVEVFQSASNQLIDNLASGNDLAGVILLGASATSNVMQGNLIGTNAAGTAAIGNTNEGVNMTSGAHDNVVGGTSAAQRNLISGNAGDGIFVGGTGSSGNIIEGNYIGTNAAGTAAIANARFGVTLYNGVANTTIGGTVAGSGNLVSGNAQAGVWIDGNNNAATSANLVEGNLIGTNAAGGAALANGGPGVRIFAGANNTTIGGTAAGAGNTIAFNSGVGVGVGNAATTGNAIQGNAIFSNTGLGIDLNNDGVTANDTGDADSGPNNLQNFPVLASAAVIGAQIRIDGTLNSTASSTLRIEFFASGTADASGHGEGQRYLGFANVTTDASGNATISVTLTAVVAAGEFISATATNASNNTSEFAANVVAAVPAIAVTPTAGLTTTEAGGTATFTVVLATRPNANVVIGVTSNDTTEGTVSTSSLTFTSANWNVAQTVTVTGVQDFITDGNVAYTIVTAAATSADASYSGLNASDVGVTNTEGANLAPVNSVPAAQTTNEDTPLVFSAANGNAITISDADAGTNRLQVTLTAGNGTLSLSGAGGLTFTSGDGTADATMTFTGTIASINAALNGASFAPAANYSGAASLQIATSDQGNSGTGGALTDTDSVAITVSAVNDAPVITSNGGGASASVSVAENASAVTTVIATDVDGPALSYSIAGGADASRFTINSSTGALSFIAAPNYEAPSDAGADNVYDVTVQASDGTLTDTQAIAVTVTPVNDNTPVITSNGGGATASVNVAENSAAVTTVVATDADLPAQTLVYSITGGADASRFAINSSTGALSFIAAPNYEAPTDAGADNVFDVTVQVSDGSLTDTQAIAVAVRNVNDAPNLRATRPLVVGEGASATIDASLLRTTDVDDAPAQLRYSIGSPTTAGRLESTLAPGIALAQFTQADVDAGQLRYVHDGSETLADTFTFVVSDASGAALASVTFHIGVLPVNDAPMLSSASSGTTFVSSGAAPRTLDPAFAVADPDSPVLTQAVVRIAGHYMQGSDRLVLAGSHPLTALWNPLDGSLTLSGAASPAAYAAALGQVQFASSSTVAGTRELSIVLSDGAAESNVLDKTIMLSGAAVTPRPPVGAPAPAADPKPVGPPVVPAVHVATPDDTPALPHPGHVAALPTPAFDAAADAGLPTGEASGKRVEAALKGIEAPLTRSATGAAYQAPAAPDVSLLIGAALDATPGADIEGLVKRTPRSDSDPGPRRRIRRRGSLGKRAPAVCSMQRRARSRRTTERSASMSWPIRA